jgi:hypothetical protein
MEVVGFYCMIPLRGELWRLLAENQKPVVEDLTTFGKAGGSPFGGWKPLWMMTRA